MNSASTWLKICVKLRKLQSLAGRAIVLCACVTENKKKKEGSTRVYAAGEAKGGACSTSYSQAVTHPSTRLAQHCLTSVIGREPVHSVWYGRRQHTSLRPARALLLQHHLPFYTAVIPQAQIHV